LYILRAAVGGHRVQRVFRICMPADVRHISWADI
jgi:hypothetical protein